MKHLIDPNNTRLQKLKERHKNAEEIAAQSKFKAETYAAEAALAHRHLFDAIWAEFSLLVGTEGDLVIEDDGQQYFVEREAPSENPES